MENNKTNFSCVGSVRGSCGHFHKTLQGALSCLNRDALHCSKQGGYSDRSLRAFTNTIPWRWIYIPTITDEDGQIVIDEEALENEQREAIGW